MFRQILNDMQATLTEKDGPTVPDVLDHLATSVLDTLKHPSADVIRAGAFALGRRGHVVPYEDFEAAFIAAINEAAKP